MSKKDNQVIIGALLLSGALAYEAGGILGVLIVIRNMTLLIITASILAKFELNTGIVLLGLLITFIVITVKNIVGLTFRDRDYLCKQAGLTKEDMYNTIVNKVSNIDSDLVNKYWFEDEHWTHARKDGNADLRYKDNPLIPLTGFITVELPKGIYCIESTDTNKVMELMEYLNKSGYNISGYSD